MKKIIKTAVLITVACLILSACDEKTIKKDENKPKVTLSDGKMVTNDNGTLIDDDGVILGTISDSGEITYSEAGASYQSAAENTDEMNYNNGDIPENAIECSDDIPECAKLGFGEGTYLPLDNQLSTNQEDYDNPDSAGYAANINQYVIKSDGKTIYFDLDQTQLKKNYIQILKRHAEALIQNEDFRVLIEGHADERGSREYNIALSERRAKAVEIFLKAEGVLSTQMTTVAYGEERPLDTGNNPAAWAKNRRAVIAYQ